jgi:hypothetical protein
MALSYSEEIVSRLLKGVAEMQESTTYQAILREGREVGRIDGEQQILLRQGTKKFGKPDPAIRSAIEAITDIQRLEALGERIIEPGIRDWNELLRTS